MVSEQYLANAAALGEHVVERLQQMTVGIKDDSKYNSANNSKSNSTNSTLSQSVISNLIGLGVGKIIHQTSESYSKLNKYNKKDSHNVNNGILFSIARHIDSSVQSLEEAIMLISPRTTYISSTGKSSNGISQNDLSSAELIIDCDIYRNKSEHFLREKDNGYKLAYEFILGAILADEARKKVHSFCEFEQKNENNTVVEINLPTIFEKSATKISSRPIKRALVIGAGGLGTYCTAVLAQREIPQIILYDPDVVEMKNLNRQLLYTNCIGEKKAEVLAARLSTEKTQIIPVSKLFGPESISDPQINQQNQKIDAIYCCTDTLESRLFVSDFASQRKIPVSEGACTASLGSITNYIPGITQTIAQQKNLKQLVELNRTRNLQLQNQPQRSASCIRSANPSIIGPNTIIGSLQALSLDYRYSGDSNSRDSTSGDCTSGNSTSSDSNRGHSNSDDSNAEKRLENYPQVFLNLMLNKKFSLGKDTSLKKDTSKNASKNSLAKEAHEVL